MLTFAIAALVFSVEPSAAARVPFKPVARYTQVGTVPGFAPPPLAAPPAILNVTVNPPAPGASYTVTVTYDARIGWVGTLPNGSFSPVGTRKLVFMPYFTTLFTKVNPPPLPYVTADQLSCRITFAPGALNGDWGGGLMRVNSDAPYTAGPLPYGSGVTAGYSFTVGP